MEVSNIAKSKMVSGNKEPITEEEIAEYKKEYKKDRKNNSIVFNSNAGELEKIFNNVSCMIIERSKKMIEKLNS